MSRAAGSGFDPKTITPDVAARANGRVRCEGFVTHWNGGAERIVGFAEQAVPDASLGIVIAESLRARPRAGHAETMAGDTSCRGAQDLPAVPALCRHGSRSGYPSVRCAAMRGR